jgi:glycosyltransferase involved in cell wall biosynthesis
VTVVGEVDVVSDELSRFDVSVAPLRIARGVQNKVLEAMAAGKAVVLTPKAAQGIGAVDGQDYVVAESDGNFAEAVFQLLEDNSARDRIGQSGRDFVKKNRRWESEMEKFEALVMEGRPTSSKFSFEVQGSKNQLENPRVVLSCATPFL